MIGVGGDMLSPSTSFWFSVSPSVQHLAGDSVVQTCCNTNINNIVQL